MGVYRYSKTVKLKKDEVATLTIKLEVRGTAAHHVIDIPGPSDIQQLDDCTVDLGTIENLETERTLIYTKASCVNPNADEVKITYKVNNTLVAKHSNLKSADSTPLVLVTINFV